MTKQDPEWVTATQDTGYGAADAIRLRYRVIGGKKTQWQRHDSVPINIDFVSAEEAVARINRAAKNLHDSRVDVRIVDDYGSPSIVITVSGWATGVTDAMIEKVMASVEAKEAREREIRRRWAASTLEQIVTEFPELRDGAAS